MVETMCIHCDEDEDVLSALLETCAHRLPIVEASATRVGNLLSTGDVMIENVALIGGKLIRIRAIYVGNDKSTRLLNGIVDAMHAGDEIQRKNKMEANAHYGEGNADASNGAERDVMPSNDSPE
jgi:hypothetical protein